MTLMDRFVRQGMDVQLLQNLAHSQAGGDGRRFDLRRGERFTVTNVFGDNTVMVRTVEEMYYNGIHRQVSFRMRRDLLDEYDPNGPAARKLGQKPEGDEYIGQDHPGIQWLWEDLHAYAQGKGWCHEFDDLANEVGIPGRPQQFEIELGVAGGTFVIDITAASEEAATELAREALLRGVQEMQ